MKFVNVKSTRIIQSYFCWVFSEYMNFNKDFDTNVGEILLDFLQFCKFCVENENSEMRRRRVFFFVTQSFKKKPKNVPLPQLELKHLCCFYFLFRLIRNGILLQKLFWPTVRKNCTSDGEKFHPKIQLDCNIWCQFMIVRTLSEL